MSYNAKNDIDGILSHMADDIKCHELWQYWYLKYMGISIDLEPFHRNKILENLPKN